MANSQKPKFSLNNCAQSPKKTFMCPKFRANPELKYTKCHTSTNLSNFLKLCLLYCQKLFALAPTNRWFAEKIWLSGNTGQPIYIGRYQGPADISYIGYVPPIKYRLSTIALNCLFYTAAHLSNQFNRVFTVLISIPRFKSNKSLPKFTLKLSY